MTPEHQDRSLRLALSFPYGQFLWAQEAGCAPGWAPAYFPDEETGSKRGRR